MRKQINSQILNLGGVVWCRPLLNVDTQRQVWSVLTSGTSTLRYKLMRQVNIVSFNISDWHVIIF